jgi:uncharacterized protein YaiI (UPF0178 family)
MKIRVDANACPVVVKEILFRAAYSQRDKQEFANNLNRLLTRHAGHS